MTTPKPSTQGEFNPGGTSGRCKLLSAIPWLWLALTAAWAAALFATDLPAWPLPLWIAITAGPLAVLRSRLEPAQAA